MSDKPRERWIIQTAVSYTIGEPVYRVQDEAPDQLTEKTAVAIYPVIEKSAYDRERERADRLEAEVAELKKDRDKEWELRDHYQAMYEDSQKEVAELRAQLKDVPKSAMQAYIDTKAKLAAAEAERDRLKAEVQQEILRFHTLVMSQPYYYHEWRKLRALCDRLADVVRMFIGYTTEADCPTPHNAGKAALAEYEQLKKGEPK